MKIKIVPVRQMLKGKVKVWRDCATGCAQAYELRDSKGKMLRRERSFSEACRIRDLFVKPRSQPVKDRSTLLGKRWADVKDRL
jgi:hypothetical protein